MAEIFVWVGFLLVVLELGDEAGVGIDSRVAEVLGFEGLRQEDVFELVDRTEES
jgi:hypothetical protein